MASTAVNTDYKQAPDCTDLQHIPGSFGMPIIGHTFALVKDLYGTIDKPVSYTHLTLPTTPYV